MTFSSIYPFYYCSSKHANEDSGSFGQIAPTEFDSNVWKAKNCHNHASLGISHTNNTPAPKQPLGNFLPFNSTYGPTIDFNSAYIDTQVKVEKSEILHFDSQHAQNSLMYGTTSHDINLSTNRKYSIESVPSLYRDTCSPFGNHLGDNSSLENSPQPFFSEHDFISSPIIQSPKSPGSYLCLQDSVFPTPTTKNSSSTHRSSVVQHPNAVYLPSLMPNNPAFHLATLSQRHHPYYSSDLETSSQNEYANYDKVAQSLEYNLPMDHTHSLRVAAVKTEESLPQAEHSESAHAVTDKPVTTAQRCKPSNRPPTSMMTTFSSKITSPSTKRYHCSICQKGFSRPSSLNTHMYSHTGEKPFQCPYQGCGRHFSVVSNLRRHTKIHNEKAT